MALNSTAPQRIFVGGTGRSGTHAIGRLLGTHTHLQRCHSELRFHADPYGLPGLLREEVELDAYLANLRGMWWKRISARGLERGLFNRIPEETFSTGVSDFERTFPGDPWGASAKLIRDLIDPQSKKKPGWIELTKRNVEASPVLCKLLPDCKIIHMVRDGRDSAASVITQAWGPDDLDEALAWWEARLTGAEAGSSQIPADRLLVIDFQDFVSEARAETYDRLMEFVGTGRIGRLRQTEMRKYFNEKIGGRAANVERWRNGLTDEKQAAFSEDYVKALERLIAINGPARPVFERWLARVG
jgi:hypothetical protein